MEIEDGKRQSIIHDGTDDKSKYIGVPRGYSLEIWFISSSVLQCTVEFHLSESKRGNSLYTVARTFIGAFCVI